MTLPVLIITYSRVKGLESLLNSCISAGIQRIYVAIDGPKDSKTSEIQNSMHEFLRNFESINQVELHVWQRTQNLGICVSVVTAIDWFFKNEPAGAILEDDLVLSNGFFQYADLALKLFESREDISIVSGNRYDGDRLRRPVLVSYPQTWGWATWREKWELIREDISQESSKNISARNLAISNFWQIGANRVWQGYIDTWDLLVARSLILRAHKCLLPPGNLISNSGNDIYSTHTIENAFPINFPIEDFELSRNMFEDLGSKVSLVSDKYLEKRVFGIRFRHTLLKLYGKLIESKMPKKYSAGSLTQRLDQVLIP